MDRGPLCGSGVVSLSSKQRKYVILLACNVEGNLAAADKDAWLEMVSAVMTRGRRDGKIQESQNFLP